MSLLRGTRLVLRLDARTKLVQHCTRGYATQAKKYDQSHAQVEGSAPLSNDTFQSLLARGADKYEDKDAFVSHSEDVKHTHKEIKSITDGFGIGLIAPGRLGVGERFLVCVPDGQHHLYAYLAAGRDGVLFYPNPHNIPMSEFLLRIREAKGKAILMPETLPNRDFIEDLDNAMPEYRSLQHGAKFKFPRVPDLRTLFHTGENMWPGMVSWGSICLRNPAKSPLVPKLPDVAGSQPVLALPQERTFSSPDFTLSVHTQEALIRTGIALAEALGIKESDRVQMTVPYYLGLVYPVVLGVLHKAAVLVQPFYKFRTQYIIDSIVKDKTTIMFIRDSDVASLLEQPLEKFDISSLRTVVVVGGLQSNVESQIKTKLKAKEVYGLDVVADMPGQLTGLIHSGGKATALPYSQAKIVDAQGATVKLGTSGTLKTKGPHVSTSHGGPASWADKDGWLDTGLQAKMAEDGSFTM